MPEETDFLVEALDLAAAAAALGVLERLLRPGLQVTAAWGLVHQLLLVQLQLMLVAVAGILSFLAGFRVLAVPEAAGMEQQPIPAMVHPEQTV
jgi:hypothetical protein